MKLDDSYRQYKSALKKYILNKANIMVVSPGDCKAISTAIEKNTGKIISETTLKRFLGFARQEYNLSAFTLNALSEFAGFKGWEDFCNTVPLSGSSIEGPLMWDRCREKALKVTCMTEKMLMNSSSVPFSYTVSRAAKEHDFSYFLESQYQLFCLTGAPGMGKSVQMAHLVKKFFLEEDAPYKESIVLLLKPGTLRSLTSHLDLDELADGLTMEEELNFLEYFYQHQDEVKGKIVLMLDGFDEYLQQSTTTDIVFSRIMDLLSYFKGIAWLKIVLSLRPATWKLIKDQIDDSEYLKQTWFSGFYYQRELKSNLLPLNEREVRQVIRSMQSETQNILIWNNALSSLFGFPHFINLCYQSLRKKPHTVLRGNTLFCELISSFISHKIDRSQYAGDKTMIIQKFIKNIDYGLLNEQMEKNQLLRSGENISFAYNELLAEGILQERESDRLFSYEHYVLFVHEPLMNYFIVQGLLAREKESIKVIGRIISDYGDHKQRKVLLKWVLWHQLLKKTENIPDIFTLELSPDEKGELLIFICDLLEERPGILDEEEKKDFTGKVISFMVDNFFSLSRLDVDYDEAFRTLLKHVVDPVHEANLAIFLAVLALARFDQEMLSMALKRLQHIDKKIWADHYPLNPLRALELIEDYFTAKNLDYSFLDEVDGFINSDRIAYNGQEGRDEAIIAHQLTAFSLMLCRPPMHMIEFVSSINKSYTGVCFNKPSNNIITYLEAFAFLQCSMKGRAMHIIDGLQACHPSLYNQNEYSHAELLLEMIKAEVDVLDGRDEHATCCFLKIYHACKHSGFILLEIYAVLSLLKIYKEQEEHDKVCCMLDQARKALCHSHFPIEELILKRIKEHV